MKHKHSDLIKLWADGEMIQVLSSDGVTWEDCSLPPLWNPCREYRIKPEHKPDLTFNFYAHFKRDFICPSYYFSQVSEDSSLNNLKITFDGTTGKLKSAEVLK